MPEHHLPNRESAWISPTKITDYLLSATQVIGKTKAQFFHGHGYDIKNIGVLKRDMMNIAKNGIRKKYD